MRAEEVATTILEIAFAKKPPPPALNIVNPRGVAWTNVLASVREEIIEQKNLHVDAIPVMPFEDWFRLLEKQAEGACSEDIARVVRVLSVSSRS